MKIKKQLMVLFAVLVMAFSLSPFALADTNPEGVVQEQAAQTMLVNSKYLTKGGAAAWFIVTIIFNVAVSFAIGNRFYRLAKKDNHVSAEIRALRKDVEEKFVRTVGGFAESEVDIQNLNESLAMSDDGINPPENQVPFREASPEEEERFRRWEEAQSQSAVRAKAKSALKEELDEDLNDVRRIKKKNYQPERPIKAERAEEDDEDDTDAPEENIEATKQINLNGENGVKTKAKEILNDMFPFKED